MTRAAAAGLIVALWAATPSAQDSARSAPPDLLAGARAPAPSGDVDRVGVSGPPYELTLDSAIRLALEQNGDVAVARLEVDAATQDVRAALGAFDPRFLPTFGARRTITPVASSIGGSADGKLEEKRIDGTAGLSGLSPWAGGRFAVDFSSSKVTSSNTNLRLNPQFPSALGLSYVQPLVRGRQIDDARRQVLVSRKAADLTDEGLRLVLMNQLSLVEQAFWDLVFARGNLDVQMTALEQARRQVESNQRQVAVGRLAVIDVVEAATQVANFQQTVASARLNLTAAENRLKNLMLSDRGQSLWSRALVPADATDRGVPALTLDQATTLALSRRPELTSVDLQLAQNEIDRRYFADQARPRVDLMGQYTLAGLAGAAVPQTGTAVGRTDAAVLARLNDLSLRAGLPDVVLAQGASPPLPAFLVGGYGDSLANLWERRFPTAAVQVQLDIPLGNRTAQAQLARSRIEETEISRRRQQLEQSIEAEVRDALQAVQSSHERLTAASAARHNAEEQYASEKRRFDSGLSTVFLVLQRQTSLVTAQALELRARTDLNQAISIFDRAVGGTLEQLGVSLQSQPPPAPAP
jgi:outer membrane protein TolC